MTTTLERPRRSPKARGSDVVQAGMVPGGVIREIPVREGLTAIGALKGAGVQHPENYDIKVNGKRAKPKKKVKPGDTVLAVGKIRGG